MEIASARSGAWLSKNGASSRQRKHVFFGRDDARHNLAKNVGSCNSASGSTTLFHESRDKIYLFLGSSFAGSVLKIEWKVECPFLKTL